MTAVILYEKQPCRRRCRCLPWYSRGKSEESEGIMEKQILFPSWRKNFPTIRTFQQWNGPPLRCEVPPNIVSSQRGKVIRWNLVLVRVSWWSSNNTTKFNSLTWQKFNFLHYTSNGRWGRGLCSLWFLSELVMGTWAFIIATEVGKGMVLLESQNIGDKILPPHISRARAHHVVRLKGFCSENRKPEICRE